MSPGQDAVAPILRCFVAMAIRDGEDTDALHFKVIKPLLRRQLRINAVRVDEIHHNKNIDERILREINNADLLIADLTYERPSVYFEAGYGESKGIPVIYTCRSDHFRRDSTYQIHFDLRQRNIIGWAAPADSRFSRRLVARIRQTVAPLRRSLKRDDAIRSEELAFAAMSPARRVALLRSTIDQTLRKAGFTFEDEDSAHYLPGHRVHRVSRAKATTVQVFVYRTLPKADLRRLAWAFAHPIRVVAEKAKGRRASHHVIVATESRVAKSRVEAVFENYELIRDNSWMAKIQGANRKFQEHWFHVADAVRSIPQFREKLVAILDRI